MARQRKPNTSLRGYVWFEYVLWRKGWTRKDMEKYQSTYSRNTLASKWHNREVSPSDRWVKKMAEEVPGSRRLYDLPLWQLLEDKELSIARINSLMSDYCVGEKILPYRFPDDDLTTTDRKPVVVYRNDSHGLFERGDIYGFMAIVALVREAEVLANKTKAAERSEENLDHEYHMSNLYRALPALGKFDWLNPDFGLLCQVVRSLHNRVDYTSKHLGIDWDIVDGQRRCRYFKPYRNARAMDLLTRRFQEIADPVIMKWSNDAGKMPNWPPPDSRKRRRELHSKPFSSYRDELSEEDIQNSNSADLLFRRFLQIAREWNLERYSWEPMLGVRTTDLDCWQEEYPAYLPQHVEIRVYALIALHAYVSRKGLSVQDLRAFLDQPIPKFDGESIRVALTRGYVVALYEHFGESEVVAPA